MNNLVIWMDGKWTPLNGKRLKLYIMSMREVVGAKKSAYCILIRKK